MTKTKIAFAAVLLAVSSSAVLAAQQHRNVHSQSTRVLQQREVALPSEPAQGNSSGPFWYDWSGPTKGGM
jgi:hypothetical protein